MNPRNSFHKMYMVQLFKLFFCLLLFVLVSAFILGCAIPLNQTYIKARNPNEMKSKAFEICGFHYRVLSYEDDTAKIECLDEGEGCEYWVEGRSSSAHCNKLKKG